MRKKLTEAEQSAFLTALPDQPEKEDVKTHRLSDFSAVFRFSFIWASGYAAAVLAAIFILGDKLLFAAHTDAGFDLLSNLLNVRRIMILALLVCFHLSFHFRKGFATVAIIAASYVWYMFIDDFWAFWIVLEQSPSIIAKILVILRPITLFSITWIAIEYNLRYVRTRG